MTILRINKNTIRVHLADVYYLLLRFNVDTVESAAKNVFLYLLKKQRLIQGLNVEKEKNRLRAELGKVKKMVGKFNPE